MPAPNERYYTPVPKKYAPPKPYVPQQPLSTVTGSTMKMYQQPYYDVANIPAGVSVEDWNELQNQQVTPPEPRNYVADYAKQAWQGIQALPEFTVEGVINVLKSFKKYDYYQDSLDDTSYLPGQGGGGAGKVMASMVPPPLPEYTIAEAGDTYETIGASFDFDPTTVAQMNPDISAPKAGMAINLPGLGEGYSAPTPTPDPKAMLDTGAPIPTEYGDINYPEGWNMAKLKAAVYGGGGVMDFASKFYGGDYTKRPGEKPPHPYESMTMEYATSHPQEAQKMYEDYQAANVPTEELPAWPGLPSSHAWAKDPVTGDWIRKPHESVFDELYVMNGVDPTNPDEVELFWSFADDDLLFAGELFDVIDWDTDEGGGYGGYGAMPTPSRQYGRGQQPARGDYATYLGLTSWSI